MTPVYEVVSFLLSYAKNSYIWQPSKYSLTPDKELNILMPSYVIIYKSYTLLKMVHFWPTLQIS